MVTLKHDRAWGGLVAFERAAGDAGDRLAGDDLLAVESHRDLAAHQGDIQRLPLAGFLCGIRDRRQESVDAADLMAINLGAEVVFDLYFVAAAKIDAAVTALGIAEFGVQLEVSEFLL